MSDEFVFEKLDTGEEKLESEFKKIESNENNNNKDNEFINGLPDWDLVPPNEVVRRNQL